MLRFPNPSSDIHCIIRLFQSIFKELSDQESISLDDISRTIAINNLAASCGRTGKSALERSTRDDRSRDPLYNQSKQYTELFRALGWIIPLSESRLTFQFTTLGAFVYSAGNAADKLVEQCILGIAFPNPVLDIKFKTSVRPFFCILRAMRELDGCMCRDEIIFGPMAISDDRNPNTFQKMIKDIQACRRDKSLKTELTKMLKSRGITHITAGNYTRFPLGVLKWAGWVESEKKNIYHEQSQRIFFRLTQKGKNLVNLLENFVDFRGSDFAKLRDDEIKKSFLANAFFGVLERSDFDLTPIDDQFKHNEDILKQNNINVSHTIFSPFQELPQAELTKFINIPVIYRKAESAEKIGNIEMVPSFKDTPIITKIKLNALSSCTSKNEELQALWKNSLERPDIAIRELMTNHAKDNKDVFYPFVADLFKAAGFNCEVSRTGVNYQRQDASIEIGGSIIPIEIKSPGEELQLSTKAIRQAAENHIILLARSPELSQAEHTSLIVCYQYPNERAEVNELVNDFKKAFDITIGIIDLQNLAKLAFANSFSNRRMTTEELEILNGFLDVNN